MKTLSRSITLLLFAAMPLVHAEQPTPNGGQGAEDIGAQTSGPSEQPQEIINANTRQALVNLAIGLLNTTYRYGGNSPLTGFDCSGLVRHVYEQAAGLTLPRSSREMARTGAKVDLGTLLPGDLLFFARPRQAVSHVGIYIGDGQFIHAASRSKRVKMSEIDEGYYVTRLVGARRYLPQ